MALLTTNNPLILTRTVLKTQHAGKLANIEAKGVREALAVLFNPLG